MRAKTKPADTIKAITNFEVELKAKVAAAEKHKELWQGLNQFITRNGGYLISPPHAKRLLMEVPQYSELPEKLSDLGYDLRAAGTNSRIIAGNFVPVIAYCFTIPVGK